MFTMLTGRPPFDGEGAGELILAHVREPAPLASSRIPELPVVIDEILEKCMRKSPADRFQSMTELVQALAFAEETPYRSNNAIEPSDGLVPSRPASGVANESLSGTTLISASGQTSVPELGPGPRRYRGGRWISGLLAAMLAVAGAVAGAAAFVALRGGDASPHTTPAAAPGGSGNAEPHAPSAVLDAMPSTATQPAPAVGNVDTVVTAGPDAGASDAESVAEAIDAAVGPRHRKKPGGKGPQQPSTGGQHERSTGSATPTIIDRGD
jgi:serine/threonine-protein kinase